MSNVFIVNKKAGKDSRREEIVGIIESNKKSDDKIIPIEKDVSFEESLRIVREQAEMLSGKNDDSGLYVIGGDGTYAPILEVVDGLVPVGLFPGGTGNDYAKSLYGNIKFDKDFIVRLMNSTKSRLIDTIHIVTDQGESIAVNEVSLGLTADACSRIAGYRNSRMPAKMKYISAAISSLINYKAPHTEIEVVSRDGGIETYRGKVLVGAFCSGKSFGGGLNVSPNGELGDGKFEFVLAPNRSKADCAFHLIPKLLKGTHLDDRDRVVYFDDAERVKILSEESFDCEKDGDTFKTKLLEVSRGKQLPVRTL